MKRLMRKRYNPLRFHRDLYKHFCRLTQGNKTVEEYYDDFEHLINRLAIEDSMETLMAQFLDGLQDQIGCKMERQPYDDLQDLLHLAVQAEQQIKRKATTNSRNRPQVVWETEARKSQEKEKYVYDTKTGFFLMFPLCKLATFYRKDHGSMIEKSPTMAVQTSIHSTTTTARSH